MPTYRTEQLLNILKQTDKGAQMITVICHEHGIAEAIFYCWRKAYAGVGVSEIQWLKELEKEHGRLKRLLAERVLEINLLKELLEKNRNEGRKM